MPDSTKYTSKLHGRKVVIFGGSSGLGFAAAEASIEHGASVVISSSSATKVDQAVERIKVAYPSAADRIAGHECDLGDTATLEENIVAFFERVGTVDHIIHTAGDALAVSPLSEITIDKAIKSSTVRLFAPMLIGKHAATYISPGPSSSITLTTGAVTLRPFPNWVLPGSTMCAVEGLMRGLALDLAPIRVNVVCPGAVETELWSGMSDERRAEFKRGIEGRVPTGRMGRAEDVAEAYLYLMRDANVTGTSVQTNSGALLK